MDFLNRHGETITGYLSRESCLKTSLGIYIKDIKRVSNRQPEQMLLVDNLAYSFGHMIDNGIPVAEFLGDQSDRELMHLEKYLIECAKQ
jgi:TFIIF-interacting CTD phosphatase-like protein